VFQRVIASSEGQDRDNEAPRPRKLRTKGFGCRECRKIWPYRIIARIYGDIQRGLHLDSMEVVWPTL